MMVARIKADHRATSMAKPDTSDGYMKAAYELMAGLLGTPAVVGLRGVVLWEVFAQVYGWGKLEVATLSPKDIAGRRKVSDVNVSRAIKELCFMGVLEKVRPQTYRFIKDHERYNFGETPEEKRNRTEYARNAPRLAKSFKYHPDARPAAAEPESKADDDGTPALRVINSDNPAVSQSITGDIGSDSRGTSDVITEAPPPIPPYKEGKKNTQERAGGLVVNGKDDEPVEVGGGHEVTDKHRERLRLVAAERFPDQFDWPKLACDFAPIYGPRNVAEAMKAAADEGRPVTWRYVMGIARRYEKQGGPDCDRAAKGKPAAGGTAADRHDYL